MTVKSEQVEPGTFVAVDDRFRLPLRTEVRQVQEWQKLTTSFGSSGVLQMAVGTGKTGTIRAVLKALLDRGGWTVVATPKRPKMKVRRTSPMGGKVKR
jgi:hypothetical protein